MACRIWTASGAPGKRSRSAANPSGTCLDECAPGLGGPKTVVPSVVVDRHRSLGGGRSDQTMLRKDRSASRNGELMEKRRRYDPRSSLGLPRWPRGSLPAAQRGDSTSWRVEPPEGSVTRSLFVVSRGVVTKCRSRPRDRRRNRAGDPIPTCPQHHNDGASHVAPRSNDHRAVSAAGASNRRAGAYRYLGRGVVAARAARTTDRCRKLRRCGSDRVITRR